MKLLLCIALVLTASVSYAAPASYQILDGTPFLTQTSILHVNGQAMPVQFIAVTKHSMGCVLPTGNCYPGTQLTFWIEAGAQAQNCSKWYSTILRRETNNPRAVPYPYLELVTQPAASILTDEGIFVFPLGSITCSGSLDWVNLNLK